MRTKLESAGPPRRKRSGRCGRSLFRLLADQIVTMRSPQELCGQLDELLDGVEAVRQTSRQTEKLLQAIER